VGLTILLCQFAKAILAVIFFFFNEETCYFDLKGQDVEARMPAACTEDKILKAITGPSELH